MDFSLFADGYLEELDHLPTRESSSRQDAPTTHDQGEVDATSSLALLEGCLLELERGRQCWADHEDSSRGSQRKLPVDAIPRRWARRQAHDHRTLDKFSLPLRPNDRGGLDAPRPVWEGATNLDAERYFLAPGWEKKATYADRSKLWAASIRDENHDPPTLLDHRAANAVTVTGARVNNDVVAADAITSLKAEARKWRRMGGGWQAPDHARAAFAEHLTEKYLCELLDPLPASAIVSRARRAAARCIEHVAAGEADDSDDSDAGSSSGAATNSHVAVELLTSKVREEGSKLPVVQAISGGQEAAGDDFAALGGRRNKPNRTVQFQQQHLPPGAEGAALSFAESEDGDKAIARHWPEWSCGLCSQKNTGADFVCHTCGRAKGWQRSSSGSGSLNAEGGGASRYNAADGAGVQVSTYRAIPEGKKKGAYSAEAFARMKRGTDTVARERGKLTTEIRGLIEAIRSRGGTLT